METIVGRLIAILYARGIITKEDSNFILGKISEEEYIETLHNDEDTISTDI